MTKNSIEPPKGPPTPGPESKKPTYRSTRKARHDDHWVSELARDEYEGGYRCGLFCGAFPTAVFLITAFLLYLLFTRG